MNASNKNPSDVLWKGEPWPEGILAELPRPSAQVRDAVYAAARTRAEINARRHARHVFVRKSLAYLGWAVSACIVLAVCIQLSPGSGSAPVTAEQSEFSSMVVAATDALDSAPVLETNAGGCVDLREVTLASELASIEEQLAYLEAELMYDAPASQNL